MSLGNDGTIGTIFSKLMTTAHLPTQQKHLCSLQFGEPWSTLAEGGKEPYQPTW